MPLFIIMGIIITEIRNFSSFWHGTLQVISLKKLIARLAILVNTDQVKCNQMALYSIQVLCARLGKDKPELFVSVSLSIFPSSFTISYQFIFLCQILELLLSLN